MTNFFKVLKKSKKSKARLGVISTSHGRIKTPAFVPVATKGTLKALPPAFAKEIGIQVSFVNSYHLVTHPGPEIIAKTGGIHKLSQLNYPLMSDSGGFQVFSLAGKKTENSYPKKESRLENRNQQLVNSDNQFPISKTNINSLTTNFKSQKTKADIRGEEQPMVQKISEDGVIFRSVYDGKLIEFTPEKSIGYQQQIGADLVMAFDECTYYPSTHEYAKKAMNRTHAWLKRCIRYFQINRKTENRNQKYRKSEISDNPISDFRPQFSGFSANKQYLYGIIQGGTYEDLRKESAKFVTKQNVDGVAIGGVSVGETKQEMREQVSWVSDYLPEDKPVHLLGVGQIDDILDLVAYGIDTFDCVEPTRLARMGTLYQTREPVTRNSHLPEIDILKGKYKNDLSPVTANCYCYCCSNFTKAYLHHLFKQKEILGYTLATYHNLWVMERLFEKIRLQIESNKL